MRRGPFAHFAQFPSGSWMLPRSIFTKMLGSFFIEMAHFVKRFFFGRCRSLIVAELVVQPWRPHLSRQLLSPYMAQHNALIFCLSCVYTGRLLQVQVVFFAHKIPMYKYTICIHATSLEFRMRAWNQGYRTRSRRKLRIDKRTKLEGPIYKSITTQHRRCCARPGVPVTVHPRPHACKHGTFGALGCGTFWDSLKP